MRRGPESEPQKIQISTPLEMRGIRFANRTAMAPMVPNCAGPDGSVTDAYRDFYLARARGNVGFVILGAAFVHPDGRGFGGQLGICDDSLCPGLQSLVQSISPHSRIGVQLSFKTPGRFPETFSKEDIRTYRTAFARGAMRARRCGFEAVELHACHDYWLNYFLSPHFNHRTDAYGGTPENRFRLLGEVVEEIRQRAGEALILGVRLSMDEFVEDGLRLAETLKVGKSLEGLGVDYLSASGGIGVTQYRMSPPMEVPRGSLLPLARALKQAVSVPVIGVGRLDRPEVLKKAVEKGDADVAATARALIADPGFVAAILEGKEDRIRPCIACNFCLVCLHRGDPVRCAVNPYVGRDLFRPKPLKRKISVLVVGAGPAGLSFAATAAGRGADVTLMERLKEPGGAVNVARLPPHKQVLQDLTDYLVAQAQSPHVHIRTGEEATVDTIRSQAPDRVVIATGAVPLNLDIPGLRDNPHVLATEEALHLNPVPPGAYLIVGGGAAGLEIAEFLSGAGGAVTVIEMAGQVGAGLHSTRLHMLLERLKEAGVILVTRTRLMGVRQGMARVEGPRGETELGPFDRIVLAAGYRSDRTLADSLKGESSPIVIGDAVRPRSIHEAVLEGFDAAVGLGET